MGLQTSLGSIKEFVTRFSDIICNTVDADVIIMDNNLEIVGKSFRYFSLYNTINAGSLISGVLAKRETLIVKDKGEVESCCVCPQFENCKMVGFVGVPIIYENYAVGVISLLLPQHRVKSLFQTLDTSVEFVENMAELLAGKIRENYENLQLSQAIEERETLMDLLSEAVVYMDDFGNIIHMNQMFMKRFLVKETCVGKQIQQLLPHKVFQDYFENKQEIKGQRVYFERGEISFYGLASCKSVRINGRNYGVMFSFRSVNEVLQDAILSGKGSLVTLQWAEWIFPREVLQAARAMAVTSNHILICGKNRSMNEILAKGITNYSDRSLMGMTSLYSDNMYRDLMEVFLFDEFGTLRNAHRGTLFVQDVENLPFHMQVKILQFIKSGRLNVGGRSSVKSDVRFIFSTSKDLEKMVEKGYFSEELYYRIIEYVIQVPGFQKEWGRFQNMVNSGVKYYQAKYHKKGIVLDQGAMERLWQYPWGEDLNLLESKVETIVRRNEGVVTLGDLEDMGTFSNKKREMMSLEEIERGRIEALLQAGCKKTEIARKLGIGRATLYRKLEEYGLGDLKHQA